MSDAEYAKWLPEAVAEYATEKVAALQWSKAESMALSAREFEQLLPQGQGTPDNHLHTILDDKGAAVGMLWFAVKMKGGSRVAHIFNIEIHAMRRRQGHGYRALLALEQEARKLGLAGISLHVFGHNHPAQALYAKLGFTPTNISLFKPIAVVDLGRG